MALEDLMELNITALVLAIVGSAIFIIMMWQIPAWAEYPFRNKLIISLALPVVCYFIVSYQLNR